MNPEQCIGQLFRDLWQECEAEHGLGEKDRSGEAEKELALTGFECVGEDPTDKGEEKGKCPQPRHRDGLCRDEREQQESHDERCSIAKVATAAGSCVEEHRNEGCDHDRAVGHAGEEAGGAFRREPEAGFSSGEDVAKRLKPEGEESEEDDQCADSGEDHDLHDVAAATFGEVEHPDGSEDETDDGSEDVGSCGESKGNR